MDNKKYGWYCWYEEEKYGSWYYSRPDNTIVIVTSVTFTPEKREGKLFLGELKARLKLARKRYLKSKTP
jgi:hypothetical protein